MRRMHTKEEIFEFVKQSPTAAELAELIANTVAFDRDEAQDSGLVKVQMIGGDRGIKTEDIPEHDGVYKTDYEGIFVKTHTGQYSYKVLALFNNNFYIQDRDNTTETDFLFVATNLLVKPLYWHGINMYSSTSTQDYSYQFHILNNSPEKINTAAKFNAWLDSIAGIVIVSGSGVYLDGTTGGVVHAIVKLNATDCELYYVDSTGSHKVELTRTALLAKYNTIADDVNRVI